MFYGYLTVHSRGQINALLRKAKRYKLIDTEYNIDEIASKLQRDLFLKSTHAQHCLHHIYELNDSQCAMTLRPRGHCFKLPFFKYECNKRGFIARCLYMYSQLHFNILQQIATNCKCDVTVFYPNYKSILMFQHCIALASRCIA